MLVPWVFAHTGPKRFVAERHNELRLMLLDQRLQLRDPSIDRSLFVPHPIIVRRLCSDDIMDKAARPLYPRLAKPSIHP
jgi:hypothetical protein